MDVIDVVRAAAPESAVQESDVAAARHRLMAEVRSRPRAVRTRRRRWAWAGGLVGAGAAVAVAATVITNLAPVDPGDPGAPPVLVPAPASAAEVLERAAERTAGADDLTLSAGQYLRIEQTDSFLNFAMPDAATGELMPMGTREDAEAAFVTTRTSDLYVPADREDEWVWDLRAPWTVGDRWGENADDAVRTWERLQQEGSSTPDLWRLPGGRDPNNTESGDATLDGREDFDDMPGDPQALLDWFRANSGVSGAEADAAAVWTMSSTLSTSLAPADLRAAMFEALALVDGMHVDDPAADVATFTYAVTGDGWSRTTTFELDTQRSLITQLSDTVLPEGDSIVPQDVPDEHRVVRVSVVDEAP
ncbi:hypothetical protein AB0269_06485 [Microbacterium sp. NPDC077644]|uniref:hypothetical protein n=1 Tax=Microbacterium sp. NPDC077644 TaxID=3155055 RepID=UPI00344ED434